jgi:drug/metabolite transporter (DMT)-like permease
MNLYRRTAIAALTAAGLLWGTTVPMTKLALEWLPPGWLTIARFGLAAAVLLVALRFRVRAACSPAVLAWGAVGYGGSILVQNAGVGRTSVSHAALLVGATPVLVAVMAAIRHRSVARPVAWVGFAVSFAGVGLVAAGGGGGTTFTGDAMVLASLVFSASFTVAQARLLSGRDPVAVTAVQFLVAALATLPIVAATEGVPPTPAGADALLATAGLAIVGTLAPSTLFAYGQARVSAESAGAFVNLEPLVGAAASTVLFGDPVGMAQAAGGAAVLAGIALSSLPLLLARRPRGRPAIEQRPHAGPQHHAGRSKTATGVAGSRARRRPVAASRPDLGALDGRRGTGIATTVVGAGRAGGHLPPGRLAPPPGERPGRGRAYSYRTVGMYSFPTYLAWAALQLPGVEVEEVPT